MRQGYSISFGDKFILNEPGYSGMSLVSVKRLLHGANGEFAQGRTHTSYRTPFDITQMVKGFTRGVKALLIIQKVMSNEVVVVAGKTTKRYQV